MPIDTDPLKPEKRLSRSYIAGLIVIVLIATLTHVIMDRLLLTEQHTADVVNMAGKQRMLSQRIMQLTYRYMLARNDQEAVYFQQKAMLAIKKMDQTHRQLLVNPRSTTYQKATDGIYFDPPSELDMQVRTFLGAAREILRREPETLSLDSPIVRLISERQVEPLLLDLNKAVTLFVDASRQSMNRMHIMLWLLYTALIAVIVLEGLFVFRPAFRHLFERTRELHELARTDPLTGCHNRRSFVTLADAFQESVKRYHTPCAVLMLDIDHFKRVNDTYGHPVGDLVIQALARTCVNALRKSDVFGRLGGEEFAALIRVDTLAQALQVAEKLRTALSHVNVPLPSGETLQFTVSMGVSMMQAADESHFEALNRADAALYAAKQAGRNQCKAAPQDTEHMPADAAVSPPGAAIRHATRVHRTTDTRGEQT